MHNNCVFVDNNFLIESRMMMIIGRVSIWFDLIKWLGECGWRVIIFMNGFNVIIYFLTSAFYNDDDGSDCLGFEAKCKSSGSFLHLFFKFCH